TRSDRDWSSDVCSSDLIGLFDEDFFAYCEDGDLSFRGQLAGYRCLYVPGAVIYHVGSASTGGKRSPFATRLGSRNGLCLLVKNRSEERRVGKERRSERR